MGIKQTGFLRLWLAASIMAVSLTGCGGGGGTPTPTPTGTTTTTTTTGGGSTCGYYFYPGQPNLSYVAPGNGSMQVQFYSGGSSTSYTITATPTTGTPVTLSIPDTGVTYYSPTMTGLTNGMSYTFTVVGVNCLGMGTPSNTMSGTPATVPDAPSISSVTPGNGQVTVSIAAPASDGGNSISYYTVSYTDNLGGSGLTYAYATGPFVVTGLTNGNSYIFTVTATNSMGTSLASAPSAAVTPSTLPGAPTSVVAQAGNGQATVSFTPPASDGGSAITSYTVTPSPSGTPVTGTSSPITVTGLTNGTPYTFTVTANNANGSSSPSAASNSVIPLSNAGPYYVDPVNGSDTNVGTATAPFKTITYALTVAAGFGTTNTINAVAGTYNAASGETFPLKMVNNVNLTGAGSGTTTISGYGNLGLSGVTRKTTLAFPLGVTSTVSGFTLTGSPEVIVIMKKAASASLVNDTVTPGATTGVDGMYIVGTANATLTGDTINGTCGGWGAVSLWGAASTLVARNNTLNETCNPAVFVYSNGTPNYNVDLGTSASPGGNTIYGGTQTGGSGVGLYIYGDTSVVYASGDTWHKNTQGANSFGQYTVGTTISGSPPTYVTTGYNYAIDSVSLTPSAGLQF